MRRFVVYILSSRSRNLYVGVTNDLARRLEEHRRGLCEHTRRYRITRLMHVEVFQSPIEAIAREKQIKAWTRAKRVGLIARDNPAWNDLTDQLARF